VKAPEIKQSAEAIVLGLVSGLMGIYLLVQWRWDKTIPELIYVAAGLGLLAVISPHIAGWIAKAWMFLGLVLGKITGGVLLSLVYLLILTPLARLQSVFSKSDKFKSVKANGGNSSWVNREHAFGSKDLEELW
jgi:hypothetical protein